MQPSGFIQKELKASAGKKIEGLQEEGRVKALYPGEPGTGSRKKRGREKPLLFGRLVSTKRKGQERKGTKQGGSGGIRRTQTGWVSEEGERGQHLPPDRGGETGVSEPKSVTRGKGGEKEITSR